MSLYIVARHLHSFPTRRSSDLGDRPWPGFAQVDQRRLDDRLRGADRQPGRGVEDRVEDRKSTRLNSSHTVISYAVFCLKKKRLSSSANAESAVWIFSYWRYCKG